MIKLTLNSEDLITFSEAARILKKARPTIHYWVDIGKLHPVAIGDDRYLLHREVETLKEKDGRE